MMMIWCSGRVSPQQVYLHKSNCNLQVGLDEKLFFLLMKRSRLLHAHFLFVVVQVDFSRMLLGHARYMKAELSVRVSGGRIVRERPRRSGKIWTYYHCK